MILLKRHCWFVHQRSVAPRPRVQGRRSVAGRSDEQWAMDVTHINCGRDGTVVIDCHGRKIVGDEVALRGRARKVERALEEGYIRRIDTLWPGGFALVIRSDNGLIFQGRHFRAACRDYRPGRNSSRPTPRSRTA